MGRHSPKQRLNTWSVTAFVRLAGLPLTATQRGFPIFSMLRDAQAEDGHDIGRLVVGHSGLLCFELDQAGGWPCRAEQMQRPLPSCKGAEAEGALPHKIPLRAETWNIVTLAIELPEMIRVYLNGELVLEIAADRLPAGVASALDASEQALVAQSIRRALAVDGPFSLHANADTAGLQVFAEYKRGKAKFGKSIRSLSVGAHFFSPCDVWTEHVAYGAWRCQNVGACKPFEPIDGIKSSPAGLRNAPDADVCVYCSAKPPPSEEPPEPNPTADHPGLWIVTSRSFQELVVESDCHFFLLVSADWCPPSKAMKPDWYKLAQILGSNPDVKIGLLDSDKNRTDPRYIWEGSIPTMKLFIRGQKERPVLYEGQRELSAWIQFISKHCPELGQGQGLTAAQWSAYAVKHELPRRLGAACAWFERESRDGGPDASDLKTNPERWFAMFFQDPLAFGIASVHDFTPEEPEQKTTADEREDKDSVDDPLRALREAYSHLPLLLAILEATRRSLSASFPERPFEFLSQFFLYRNAVNAETKIHNVPAASRAAYLCGSLEVWKRLRTTEPMSKLEQKRTWRTLVDAIHAPAHAPSWQRKQMVRRMMDTIKEHVEKGFPLTAQPYGPCLAELVAGMGPDHMPLLTRLFWSGANLSAPNTADMTLPIEVAAAMGHAGVVKRLYEMGCAVGGAVHYALTESMSEVVEMLLRSRDDNPPGMGVPVALRCRGLTALEYAVIIDRGNIAEWLLTTGRARPDRPLVDAVAKRFELAPGSTLAHLLAKLGGRRGKMLERLLSLDPVLKNRTNSAGMTPCMVALSSQIAATLDPTTTACWPLLEGSLLNPQWDRTDQAEQARLETAIAAAVAHGADPASYNAIGWTCLQAAALCCEPRVVAALLSNVKSACECEQGMSAEMAREMKARAERVLYATSRSGHTALLWARWMAWVSEQLPLDPGDAAALARDQATRERAEHIATFLASRGAAMRTRDDLALENLKRAYTEGTPADRSLLRLDPSHLKVLGMSAEATDAEYHKGGFASRMGELANLKGHQKCVLAPRFLSLPTAPPPPFHTLQTIAPPECNRVRPLHCDTRCPGTPSLRPTTSRAAPTAPRSRSRPFCSRWERRTPLRPTTACSSRPTSTARWRRSSSRPSSLCRSDPP